MAIIREVCKQPTPRCESAKVLDGLHVLVVDDDEDIALVYAMSLRAAGATVRAALNGAAALEAICAGTFDIVVSDLDMPGIDGMEMMRVLRASSDPFRTIPALAVTGSARVDIRAQALRAGFDAFAVKPLSATKLLEAVKGLVRNSVES